MRWVVGGDSTASRWLSTEGVSAFAREGRAWAPLLDLAHLGWTAAASGIGARRSSMRRQGPRLRRRKRMALNFSVFQRRL
jgi:hypothetical protein